MRYTTRPVLGVLLAVVVGTNGFGEETKAPWWHFGRDKDAAERTAGRHARADADSRRRSRRPRRTSRPSKTSPGSPGRRCPR